MNSPFRQFNIITNVTLFSERLRRSKSITRFLRVQGRTLNEENYILFTVGGLFAL